jgi:hypothetical protein
VYNFEDTEFIREFGRKKFKFDELCRHNIIFALDVNAANFGDFVAALQAFANVFIGNALVDADDTETIDK